MHAAAGRPDARCGWPARCTLRLAGPMEAPRLARPMQALRLACPMKVQMV
jgi:hypothetical protein